MNTNLSEETKTTLEELLSRKKEYGGSLKIENGEFVIADVGIGTEGTINVKNSRGKVFFHTHPASSVEKNCGRDFPSIFDLQSIVEDNLEYESPFHIIYTPTGEFRVKSERSEKLYIDEQLLELEINVCESQKDIDYFINSIKKYGIKIEYKNKMSLERRLSKLSSNELFELRETMLDGVIHMRNFFHELLTKKDRAIMAKFYKQTAKATIRKLFKEKDLVSMDMRYALRDVDVMADNIFGGYALSKTEKILITLSFIVFAVSLSFFIYFSILVERDECASINQDWSGNFSQSLWAAGTNVIKDLQIGYEPAIRTCDILNRDRAWWKSIAQYASVTSGGTFKVVLVKYIREVYAKSGGMRGIISDETQDAIIDYVDTVITPEPRKAGPSRLLR